ncbi:MAG: hypothetical protein ACK5LE_03510 [Alphaproteobacteria bacterium]
MIKTSKKPVIQGLISKNRITPKQAQIAQIIQHMEIIESRIGSRTDSCCKVIIDGGNIRLGLDNQLSDDAFWNKAKRTKKQWEIAIKQGALDPLALQITKSILHYNLHPKDIATEFNEQLYQKPGGHLLRRLDIKISAYKIENMLMQALDLFIEIGEY